MNNLNEIICFNFYHSTVYALFKYTRFTELDHMLSYREKYEIPIIFIFSEYTTDLEFNKIMKSKLCLS